MKINEKKLIAFLIKLIHSKAANSVHNCNTFTITIINTINFRSTTIYYDNPLTKFRNFWWTMRQSFIPIRVSTIYSTVNVQSPDVFVVCCYLFKDQSQVISARRVAR